MPKENKIRFLTYNMFLLPPFVPGNQYRQERMMMFADTQLANYDICCF